MAQESSTGSESIQEAVPLRLSPHLGYTGACNARCCRARAGPAGRSSDNKICKITRIGLSEQIDKGENRIEIYGRGGYS